jgi:hypothetical protein
VNNSESFYPLWNPYVLGGTPTLANTERFVWLAKIIDADSENAVMNLNIIMIITITALGFTVYLLAKEVNISSYGSLSAALILTFSYTVTSFVLLSGRLSILLVWISINSTYLFYIKYIKSSKRIFFIFTIFFAGYVISSVAHYAFITLLPLMILIGIYYNFVKSKFLKQSLIKSSMQVTVICFCSISLFAVFLIPLFYYHSSTYFQFPPKSGLGSLNAGTLLNMFYPLFNLQRNSSSFAHFPFVSLALLPLLTMVIVNRKKGADVGLINLLFGFCILCIFWMAEIFPLNVVRDLLGRAPGLNHVRSVLAFYYPLTLGLALLGGFGFDRIALGGDSSSRFMSKPVMVWCLILMFILFVDLFVVFSRGFSHSTMFFLANSFNFEELISDYRIQVFCVLFICLLYISFQKHVNMKIFVFSLFLIQVVFFQIPQYKGLKFHLEDFEKIKSILHGDESYFRMLSNYRNHSNYYLPTIRKLSGFSLFFSNEHRWALETLYGFPVRVSRPHWVKGGPTKSWNRSMLDLLNIKYFVACCYRKNREVLEENWELKFRGRPNLWERREWRPALKVFDRWVVEEKVDEVLKIMRSKDFKPFEVVYLEKDVPLRLSKSDVGHEFDVNIERASDKEMIFRVSSNKDGILFVPENYDSGWKAKVDGENAEVIRANASFRGLALVEGTHRVQLYYSPLVVHLGFIISLVTMCLGIVVCMLFRNHF